MRSALDAVQAQKQSKIDGRVLTARQEQEIRTEAARRFHMLREHEAQRLQARMTPEDYVRFIKSPIAIPSISETEGWLVHADHACTIVHDYSPAMERISLLQQVRMRKVLDDIPWTVECAEALRRAYDEDPDDEIDVGYMVVKATEPLSLIHI